METHLTHAQRDTYHAIFQHPISRNLKWIDVWSMLAALADTVHMDSDGLHVTLNGYTMILHRPIRNPILDIGGLIKVRVFLARSSNPILAPHSHDIPFVSPRENVTNGP